MSFVLAWVLSGAALVQGSAGADARAPTAATAPTSDMTRAELLAGFRAMPGLFARYKEEKTMALLVAPLRSEGTLHFVRPHRLARHQTGPSKASVVVDGDTLRFGDDHGERAIDLAQNPVVRLFVETFARVLAGDEKALEAIYTVQFTPGPGRTWALRLAPKDPRMARLVESIELRGKETALQSMVIAEVGGDRTVTTFFDVDTRRTYSKRERDRLFRVR